LSEQQPLVQCGQQQPLTVLLQQLAQVKEVVAHQRATKAQEALNEAFANGLSDFEIELAEIECDEAAIALENLSETVSLGRLM
jgi:hypothetical protein